MYRLNLQGRKIRERGTSVSRWLPSAFFIATAVKTANLIYDYRILQDKHKFMFPFEECRFLGHNYLMTCGHIVV
jgi:hypothetical protein